MSTHILSQPNCIAKSIGRRPALLVPGLLLFSAIPPRRSMSKNTSKWKRIP